MPRVIICVLVLLLFSVSSGYCEFHVYSAELPPYHFLGQDQKMHGASIDILKEMMRRSNVPFDSGAIRFVPWARGMKEAGQNAEAMLIGVGRTKERENKFKWIGPYCSFSTGLIAKKSKLIRIYSSDDLRKYSIGVVNNSAADVLLCSQLNIPQDHLVRLTNDEQQFRMLQAGRIDLVGHSDIGAPYSIKKFGLMVSDYEMVYKMRTEFLYFAVSTYTDTAIVNKLQSNLNDMMVKDSFGRSLVDSIIGKYNTIDAIDVAR